MHLAKVINWERILSPFLGYLWSLEDHKNNEKCRTICKFRALACWRWGCILGFIFVARCIQNRGKIASQIDQNGIQRFQNGFRDGVLKRHEKMCKNKWYRIWEPILTYLFCNDIFLIIICFRQYLASSKLRLGKYFKIFERNNHIRGVYIKVCTWMRLLFSLKLI